MPTRALAAWHAVTSTMVSPDRTITAPSACLASLPVSIETVRDPPEMSRRGVVGIKAGVRDGGRAGRPAPPPVRGLRQLLTNVQFFDELCVPVQILPLEVIQQAAALADELEKAPTRRVVFHVF